MRIDLLVVFSVFVLLLIAFAGRAFAAEEIYQSDIALENYTTSDYELIYNSDVSRAGGGSGGIMKSVSGPEMEFRPLIYPGIANPQSMAVSPDGRTAWVMRSSGSGNDNSRHGRIYRIDLSDLWEESAQGVSAGDRVTAGPEIVTGHGQTLAYNPKTDELWYVRETKVSRTTLVQVDPDTMEIIKEIHFTFSNRVDFPPTFTFDREGNLWTYTRSLGMSWAPAGTIRFFKGTIEDDHVSFRMIKQGLRYPPGRYCQSMGYDPLEDRLYVISDGVVLTVPASKMGSITADDVETIVFDGHDEFEGMAFSETGCAYFLTNNPCEIKRDEISYQNALKVERRFSGARSRYKQDQSRIEDAQDHEVKEIIKEQIGDIVDDGF